MMHALLSHHAQKTNNHFGKSLFYHKEHYGFAFSKQDCILNECRQPCRVMLRWSPCQMPAQLGRGVMSDFQGCVVLV